MELDFFSTHKIFVKHNIILYDCTVVYMNFAAVYISPGNHVIRAGKNATFECSSSYAPPYWHFYSLTQGSRPCGFGSYRLYSGISRCPSAARISVTYPSTYRNRSTLTISRAQLSDAGTYTCGGRNPYYRSATLSAIVGVIGKCTL